MARYRVSGSQRVLGHEPGSRFEADLDPAHETRLIGAGHLTRLAEREKKPESTAAAHEASAAPKE